MAVYFKKEAPISITFVEMDGSPQESYGPGGFSSVRKLKCVYSDRHTLAQEIMGITQKSLGLVTIQVPHRHPSFIRAIAQGVDIEPMGKQTESSPPSVTAAADYDHAILNVKYAVPDGITFADPDEDIKDITRTERLETSAQFITIPEDNLFFDKNQTLPVKGLNPGFLMVTEDWTITLLGEPEIPPGIKDLIGSVNDKPIKSRKLDRTFAAETLLYNAPSLDRSIAPNADNQFDITFRLSHNPFGWNKFVRPGVFDEVVVNGVTKKIPKFVTLFDDSGKDYVIYIPKDFSNIVTP